jgi:hypothetical protein
MIYDYEGEIEMSIFEELIGKGVYIRINSEDGIKELVGMLVEYDPPLLGVSSRGKKYVISKNKIEDIRVAFGDVEP